MTGAADHVRSSLREGVLRLTIEREERLNALDRATTGALVARLAAAGQDNTVRVVVITGAGRAFCSGADLAEVSGPGADTRAIMEGAESLVATWPGRHSPASGPSPVGSTTSA